MVFEVITSLDQVLLFLFQVTLAILVGALIGIEREHARSMLEREGKIKRHVLGPIFGLRSTILFAVLGFFFSFLGQMTSNNLFLIVGAIFALTIATAVYLSNVMVTRHTGATTYVSVLLVFFLGALVGLGGYYNYVAAGALSIIITILLATKRKLVGWTGRLTNTELYAALKFGVIAFIVLPLLPDKTIDPWGVINPFSIWFVVVAVSAILFVSYVLLRQFAHKGLMFSSFFGGLISSSATTLSLANLVKQKANLANSAAVGVYLAMIATIVSDLIIVAVVFNNLALVVEIAAPLMAGALVFALLVALNFRGANPVHENHINLKSPFALMPALEFAGIYAGLLLLNGLLNFFFGSSSLALSTALASLWSSTAAMMSFAQLSSSGVLSTDVAARFIVFSIVISTLVKIVWVRASGNRLFFRQVLRGTALAAVATIAVAALQAFI